MNTMMLDDQTELLEVPLEGAIPRNRSRSWDEIFSAIAEVPGAVWTTTSMALSIAVYSAKLGWIMAAGLVALLMIHECGHLVATFLLRIPISAPISIPYLGKEEVCNRWNLALMGIAGPIAGTVASLGCYYRRPSLCKRIMLGIAYVGLVCILTYSISLIFIKDIPLGMNH